MQTTEKTEAGRAGKKPSARARRRTEEAVARVEGIDLVKMAKAQGWNASSSWYRAHELAIRRVVDLLREEGAPL